MTSIQILFMVVSALTLVSAVMVVTRKNLVHAALYLIVALFGVAVFFVMLSAGFLAVVQVLVYIGAIAIMMIFAVMLTHQVTGEGSAFNKNAVLAVLITITVFAGLYLILSGWSSFGAEMVDADTSEVVVSLGEAFFSADGYLIPTITASILLLVPLIGAIYIARNRE
jgi:NADH-quinone oxidoreductase subunit J